VALHARAWSRDFQQAIEYVNVGLPPELRVRYCALDFSQISRSKSLNLLKALEDVRSDARLDRMDARRWS
jgi:hypothetical protein